MSDTKVFSIKYKRHDCSHVKVELDMESRLVKCSLCERIIDPFDYLLSCATIEESALNRIARLSEEKQKLQKQVDSLVKRKVILGNKK